MDSKIERRKALQLAGIGSIVLVFILYGSAWAIMAIVDSAAKNAVEESVETSAITGGQDDESSAENIAITEMVISIQNTQLDTPYELNIETYVIDGDRLSGGERFLQQRFNSEIEIFINQIRDQFENDLRFFLGTINSFESSLTINAIDIRRSKSDIEIDYEISSLISGDTSPVITEKTLIISF